MAYYTEIAGYTPDNLIAGNHIPVVTEAVELKAGLEYFRGDALAYDESSKTFTLLDSASGSANILACVLLDDADATNESVIAAAAFSGEFNVRSMRFGGADTFEDHVQAARARQIYLREMQEAPKPFNE